MKQGEIVTLTTPVMAPDGEMYICFWADDWKVVEKAVSKHVNTVVTLFCGGLKDEESQEYKVKIEAGLLAGMVDCDEPPELEGCYVIKGKDK